MAQVDNGRQRLKRRKSEAMACIEARGLRKVFGTTVALDGVDFRVEEGRILGIIGPNGAGKTTALNAMLGLISYQGELRILGRDPWKKRVSASIARSSTCRKGWWRNCTLRWSWRLTRDCWCWTSRRSGSTFCFASSSTIPCLTITSIAAALLS